MAKEDTDLYKVFGVASTAPAATIKKAYHRLCLQYHPDKLSILSTDEEKQEAAVTFQRLTHYHSILADPARRQRYDETGFVGKVGGSDEENGVAFEAPEQGWTAFFKELWGGLITEDTINAFALKYRGSNEEKEDIIKQYHTHKGSMQLVLESVPLCSFEDEARFRQIVQEAVDEGTVTDVYDGFFVEDKRATERRRKQAEREEKEFLKADAARKRKEAAAATAQASAKKKGGKSGAGDGDDSEGLEALQAELKKRAQERMGGLIEKMEARALAEAESPAAGKTRRGKRATPAKSEPSEEEFIALQAKLFKGKGKASTSDTKKSGGKKKQEEEEMEEDWSDEVDEVEEEVPATKSKRSRRG
ncbi:hypothetical protein BDR26DRAFT_855695 [Obelidium mucronatum]|nr:hypothetical protein BDR26DRAFT_855695 [Obelidium mucronatum]